MKICADLTPKTEPPILIKGHLYQRQTELWLCAYENRLINIKTGLGWCGKHGFLDDNTFIDVTDEFCLKRI